MAQFVEHARELNEVGVPVKPLQQPLKVLLAAVSAAQLPILCLKLRRGTGSCEWKSGRWRAELTGQFVAQPQELVEVVVAVEVEWPLRQLLRRRVETETRPRLVWDVAAALVGPAGAAAGAAAVVVGRQVLSPPGGAGGECARCGRCRGCVRVAA